jgi:hypothetical protein
MIAIARKDKEAKWVERELIYQKEFHACNLSPHHNNTYTRRRYW